MSSDAPDLARDVSPVPRRDPRDAWRSRIATIVISAGAGAFTAVLFGSGARSPPWFGFGAWCAFGAFLFALPIAFFSLSARGLRKPALARWLALGGASFVLAFAAVEPKVEALAFRRHAERLERGVEELAQRIERFGVEKGRPLTESEFLEFTGGGHVEGKELRYWLNADGSFELAIMPVFLSVDYFESKSGSWRVRDLFGDAYREIERRGG